MDSDDMSKNALKGNGRLDPSDPLIKCPSFNASKKLTNVSIAPMTSYRCKNCFRLAITATVATSHIAAAIERL